MCKDENMVQKGDVIISVIMPVYNRGDLVGKSVLSVLNQSFPHFELLIIDDGSTDNSWDIINSYGDPRIKCLRLPVNSGAAAARNFGIGQARGIFISFLDSDDTFESGFLFTSYNKLKNTPDKVGFMWTGRNIIEGESCRPQLWNPSGPSSYHIFLKHIRIGTGAGITIKKEVFEKCGQFNEDLPAAEDTEFFFRISRHFDFTYSDEILVNIFKNPSNRLSRGYSGIAKAYNIFLSDHYEEIEKDPELQRIYYYKMMWLNFHIPDPVKAKIFFKKIPRRKFQDYIKIAFIYGIYKILPLEVAAFIHGKFSSFTKA